MRLKNRYFVFLALAFVLLMTLVVQSSTEVAATKDQGQEVTAGAGMFVENVGQFESEVRFQARLGREVVWLTDEAIWLTLLPESGGQELGVHLALTFPAAGDRLRLEPFGRRATTITYGGPDGALPAVPAWSGVRFVDLYPGVDLELVAGNSGWRWGLESRSGASTRPLAVHVAGAEGLALAGSAVIASTAVGEYRLPDLSAGRFSRVEGSALLLEPGFQSDSQSPAGLESSPAAFLGGSSGLLYSTFVGGEAWDEARAITVDKSGRAFVTGYTQSLVFPTRPGSFEPQHGIDVYIFKLNGGGTDLAYMIWLYTATLNAEDYGNSILVNDSGHAFVAGYTFSIDFCSFLGDVPGYDRSYNGSGDAFLMKLLPDGTGMVYCTYLGAGDLDLINSLAVDEDGQVYATGSTWSIGFPTTAGAYDTSHNDLRDVFLLKLDADGTSLLYSTFLGGAGQDETTGLAVNSAGQAYLTGWTTSNDFPTTPGAFDPDHNGGTWDAFVTRVAADGGSLNYSTYFGGSSEDRAEAIGLDDQGRAYIAGSTASSDIPVTAGAFDPDFGGDVCGGLPCDAFVASLNPGGTNLGYATYLGGEEEDLARDLVVVPGGRAYVTGRTQSPDFPVTASGLDPTHNGGVDGFVTLLESDGRSLLQGTFLGGTLEDEAKALWVDGGGSLFVTGRTQSPDFPVTAGSYDPGHNGDNDIFVSGLTIDLLDPQLVFLPLIWGG